MLGPTLGPEFNHSRLLFRGGVRFVVGVAIHVRNWWSAEDFGTQFKQMPASGGRLNVSPRPIKWMRLRDLNPRPPAYEADELPGCSKPQFQGNSVVVQGYAQAKRSAPDDLFSGAREGWRGLLRPGLFRVLRMTVFV